MRELLSDCKVIDMHHGEVLGAPLSAEAPNQCLSRKANTLKTITTRLALLNRHDGHALLRCSLGHPRITYDLRAAPCFASAMGLTAVDNSLREAFPKSGCVALDDASWKRATLPPTMGGIGLQSATDMELPQFLA